jgi:hypothetical protein
LCFPMDQNRLINWNIFWILLLISTLHLLFLLILVIVFRVAYVREVPFEFMVDVLPTILFFVQAIGFGLIIFIGLYLGKEIGFGAPLLERWLNKEVVQERIVSTLKLSIGLGIIVAVEKFILDRFIFSPFVPSLLIQWKQMPFGWKWVVPFQQGIGEEISHRLFWMTLLVWIIYKIQKPENNQPTSIGVWIPIIIVTILSLPGTIFWGAAPLIKLEFIILAGTGGIIFGWLYWKKGIESAIIAHFIADVVLVLLTLV